MSLYLTRATLVKIIEPTKWLQMASVCEFAISHLSGKTKSLKVRCNLKYFMSNSAAVNEKLLKSAMISNIKNPPDDTASVKISQISKTSMNSFCLDRWIGTVS